MTRVITLTATLADDEDAAAIASDAIKRLGEECPRCNDEYLDDVHEACRAWQAKGYTVTLGGQENGPDENGRWLHTYTEYGTGRLIWSGWATSEECEAALDEHMPELAIHQDVIAEEDVPLTECTHWTAQIGPGSPSFRFIPGRGR
jgi:hypothetical protein